MSTSTGVNVLRWSALFLGGGYGLFHQSSLKTRQKTAEIDQEYQRKEDLIQQAKAAYVKKTMPKDKKTESGGIITDPMDDKFDLEAYLTTKMGEAAK